MVVLAQGLPQAKGEDQLAIGQMSIRFPARSTCPAPEPDHTLRAKVFEDGLNFSRGQGEHFQWLLAPRYSA